jgi:hypothetical protein
MVMRTAKKRPRPKRDAPRANESVWYSPTVADVYAQVLAAKTMLDRIPNAELAIVKREMGILEDMMWQFAGE